jgi:hypothetical protein
MYTVFEQSGSQFIQVMSLAPRQRRAEVARQINTATREVLATRKPAVIVTEKLDIRGKTKSKKLSRRVTLWARRTRPRRRAKRPAQSRSARENTGVKWG